MRSVLIALISGTALAIGSAAFAAGGGGGGGGGGAGGGNLESSALVEDADFQAGMVAVKRHDWQKVAFHMGAYTERSPHNADAWNELGHAHRQLGDMTTALADYAKALQLNPQHRGAHEYLGEAYLIMGDLASAEKELKALNSICFLPCEEYTELKEGIATFKSRQAKAGS